MTTDQVLSKIRRLIAEVDQVASLLTDEEILGAVADARDYLELVNVPEFNTLAVDTDVTSETYGITDEDDLTLQLGTILAYLAAATLLEQAYHGKVQRGELGVSWSSGLEAESTLQAGRTYLDAVNGLRIDADALILSQRNNSLSSRSQ